MKRSRFTVTASRPNSNAIEKFVVLAYSAESLREHYIRRGWYVRAIERGDYRKAARGVAARAFHKPWKVDQVALREAIDVLGIKWPVRIRFNARHGNTNGNHMLDFDAHGCPRGVHRYSFAIRENGAPFHNIMLKSYLSPAKAGEVLWHELAHGMQAERECAATGATTARERSTAWKTCNARGVGIGYRNKPIEVEAREFECWNNDHPLVKEA